MKKQQSRFMQLVEIGANSKPGTKERYISDGITWIMLAIIISVLVYAVAWLFVDGEDVVGVEVEVSKQELQDRAKAVAEYRATGFHCLSTFNGAHRDIVRLVREQLKDPSSFDHVETRITRVSDTGTHQLFMDYRARNGFGGMITATAIASIDNSSCEAALSTVE